MTTHAIIIIIQWRASNTNNRPTNLPTQSTQGSHFAENLLKRDDQLSLVLLKHLNRYTPQQLFGDVRSTVLYCHSKWQLVPPTDTTKYTVPWPFKIPEMKSMIRNARPHPIKSGRIHVPNNMAVDLTPTFTSSSMSWQA